MGTWKKIGCAVDGSPASMAAMHSSAELARQCGAELVLVHVESPAVEALLAPPASPRKRAHAENERLSAWTAEAAKLRDGPVRLELSWGPAAHEITEFARREGCDLLVLGTRARHAATFGLTSVAAHVVPHSPCSVLLVPLHD